MSTLRKYAFPGAGLFMAVILLAAGLPALNVSASQTLVFTPAADAYVESATPAANFGTLNALRADGSPIVRSYIRFDASAVGANTITSARLLVYMQSSTSNALQAAAVSSNNWNETTITYNNAPAAGAAISSVTGVTSGTWVSFNVSAYVKTAGVYSLALVTPGSTNIKMASREYAGYAPRLEIITSSTVTSTNTPIPAASLTPTRTATTAPAGPTATRTATATATTAPVAPTASPTANPADPVLVGAGDITDCGSSGDEATAKLVAGIPGTVFTAGDNAYEDGSTTNYTNCYNPSWGPFKTRTRPSPGNHDYHTSGASGYFGYYGTAAGDPSRGYYSYNLGTWHIISLNSEIDVSAASAQVTWLRQDLAANPRTCTLAYWHRPLFSSGSTHGSNPGMAALWQALYNYHADLVVNAHEHNYERFAPQNATGTLDTARGIREFVVGTGGKSHYSFGAAIPNSLVRNGDTFGVIMFTLHASGYDWKFVPEAGKTFTDSGTAQCVP